MMGENAGRGCPMSSVFHREWAILLPSVGPEGHAMAFRASPWGMRAVTRSQSSFKQLLPRGLWGLTCPTCSPCVQKSLRLRLVTWPVFLPQTQPSLLYLVTLGVSLPLALFWMLLSLLGCGDGRHPSTTLSSQMPPRWEFNKPHVTDHHLTRLP